MEVCEVTLNRQLILGLLLLPFSANGGVYRWVDENQQIHFGNVPPQQQSEYRADDIDDEPARKPATVEGPGLTKAASAPSTTTPSTPSNAPSIASKPSKQQKVEELERLIQHLRAESKQTPSGNNTTPEPTTSSQPAKANSQVIPGESTGVAASPPAHAEPPATTPVSTKPGLPRPVPKQAMPSPQGGSAETTSPQDGQEKKSAKDAEMCGVFRGFMQTYQQKVQDGCPGAHCPVYQRQLKKYQLKVKRYCE